MHYVKIITLSLLLSNFNSLELFFNNINIIKFGAYLVFLTFKQSNT